MLLRRIAMTNMSVREKFVYTIWASPTLESAPKYRHLLMLLFAVMLLAPSNIAAQDKNDTEAYWASIDKDEARTRTGYMFAKICRLKCCAAMACGAR